MAGQTTLFSYNHTNKMNNKKAQQIQKQVMMQGERNMSKHF